MEKQYYTVREIILGLREEYIKNQKALEHLKNYMTLVNREIEDFRITIGNKEDEELIARFQKRGNILQRVIKTIMDDYVIEEEEAFHDNEALFYSKNLMINDTRKPEFKEAVEKIFRSPFVEKIGIHSIFLTGKGFDASFGINENGIKLYKTRVTELESVLEYSAPTDTLLVKSGKYSISNANLTGLLDLKVPCMVFKNYHKELIDKNGNKTLYAEVFHPCLKAKFTFHEQSGQILLVKTM